MLLAVRLFNFSSVTASLKASIVLFSEASLEAFANVFW